MENRLNFFRHRPRKRQATRITVPSTAGPHVKLVFAEMARQNITYDEVEDGSGVLRSTLKAWRHKNAPGLTSMEAVLGFIGWDFVPIPRAALLPKALLDDLKPLAERHGVTMERAIAAWCGIAARERGTVGDVLPFVGQLRAYPAPENAPPAGEVDESTNHASLPQTASFHWPADIKGNLPCAA